MPRSKTWRQKRARKNVIRIEKEKSEAVEQTSNIIKGEHDHRNERHLNNQQRAVTDSLWTQNLHNVQAAQRRVNIQATQSPVIVQATQSPVNVQATQSPVNMQATQSPVNMQATQSPVNMQATQSPVNMQATQCPINMQIPQSPVNMQATQSPVNVQATQSPVTVQATQSPVNMQATQSPVNMQATQSPVTVRATQSPVDVQATQSFLNVHATQSPLNVQKQKSIITDFESPDIKQAQSPVITQAPLKMKMQNKKLNMSLQNQNNQRLQNENCYSSTQHSKEHTNIVKTEICDQHVLSKNRLDVSNSVIDGSNLYVPFPLALNNKLQHANIISNDCSSSLASKCTTFILGSYHQGDRRFPVFSRGSQCTLNSLCALIYAQYANISTKANLDEILNLGDQLYQRTVQHLKKTGKFKHRLLCFDEIPDTVNILSRVVNVHKGDIKAGLAVEQVGNSGMPTLHESLYNSFWSYQSVMVLIGAVCCAVFVKNGMYCLFDSHSHNEYGLSCPEGKAVLMSFSSLDDLVSFMYAMYQSMKIDLSDQYEILPVQFSLQRNVNDTFSDLLLAYFDDQRKKNEMNKLPSYQINKDNKLKKNLEWSVANREKGKSAYFRQYQDLKRQNEFLKVKEKVIQRNSKRKAKSFLDFKENKRANKQKAREDTDYKKNEINLNRQSNTLDKVYKTQNSLGKQMDKNKSKNCKELSVTNHSNIDRCAYFRKYKHLKRQNEFFKVKEKVIQRKSKRKARKSLDYKENERANKQKTRENIDFRKNENKLNRESKLIRRLDKDYKRKETLRKQIMRKDKEFKKKESKFNKESKKNKKK